VNSQEKMNVLKQVLTFAFAYVAGKGWITFDQATALVNDIVQCAPYLLGAGSIFWSAWSHWNMVKVQEKTPVVTGAGDIPASSALKQGLVGLFLLMAFSATLIPAAHAANQKPLAITGNPAQDIKTDIQNAKTTAAAINAGTAAPTCDFNVFVILTPQNVVGTLQACGQILLTDSNAALASAGKASDSIATACLTPGTALVQAAVGTPEVPATATAPVTPAVLPGPILIFQKFREFVDAGGITNCKAWVNNTVSAATASGL
jgi:hypothetical protein